MIWQELPTKADAADPGAVNTPSQGDAAQWVELPPAGEERAASEHLQRCAALLGISPDANADTVHNAYRRLATRYHPDLSSDEEERAYADRRMRDLNIAYQALRSQTRA